MGATHWLRAALLFVLAGIACHAVAQTPASEKKPIPFSLLADLRARHPAVVSYDGFAAWLKENGFGRWHETPRDASGLVTVVVQARHASRLFAAQVVPAQRDREEQVKRAQFIDAGDNTRENALAVARDQVMKKESNQRLHAVRPVVTFLDDGTSRLTWEIEIAAGAAIDVLEFDHGRKAIRPLPSRKVPGLPPPGAGAVPPGAKGAPVPEELAANELHHPAAFLAEAALWTKGASSVQEKARLIYENVSASYAYDPYIEGIWDFTWSDLLVRDANGRKGICDEFSVVQVSYLRALGIPARLKLLVWTDNDTGKQVSHSSLEYADGSTWRHMDALWGFNDPGVYRRKVNAKDVTVMDADAPLDARSTEDSFFGKPDLPGDGKLNPFLDFVLKPAIPGEKRPGYSD